MNFSFYIARRYLFSKSKNNAITIISRIATVGIIVSAMALFVVLSVFSGLKTFSLSFTNSLYPDLQVAPTTGKTFFVTNEQLKQIRKIDGINTASLIIEEKTLVLYNNKEIIATLKGVDSQYTTIIPITENLYMGEWLLDNSPEVVLGAGIAHQLSVNVYDYTHVVQLFVPKAGKGAISNPDQAFTKINVIPSGIYSINEDVDLQYVFSSVALAKELLGFTKDQYSLIEVKLKLNASENDVKQQIQTILKTPVTIKNKTALNDALYKMLNTENLVVYLIFTLVIIVALFNLIGSLIMMILEKKENLKTLYNIGVEIHQLKRIFLLQGFLLSSIGGIIGLVLGIIIVFLQQQYELIMITPVMAYPVEFTFWNIITVFLTICILGYIAAKIAANSVHKKLLE